jgi:hypothetical protein
VSAETNPIVQNIPQEGIAPTSNIRFADKKSIVAKDNTPRIAESHRLPPFPRPARQVGSRLR